jgi:hypothetical protein
MEPVYTPDYLQNIPEGGLYTPQAQLQVDHYLPVYTPQQQDHPPDNQYLPTGASNHYLLSSSPVHEVHSSRTDPQGNIHNMQDAEFMPYRNFAGEEGEPEDIYANQLTSMRDEQVEAFGVSLEEYRKLWQTRRSTL